MSLIMMLVAVIFLAHAATIPQVAALAAFVIRAVVVSTGYTLKCVRIFWEIIHAVAEEIATFFKKLEELHAEINVEIKRAEAARADVAIDPEDLVREAPVDPTAWAMALMAALVDSVEPSTSLPVEPTVETSTVQLPPVTREQQRQRIAQRRKLALMQVIHSIGMNRAAAAA